MLCRQWPWTIARAFGHVLAERTPNTADGERVMEHTLGDLNAANCQIAEGELRIADQMRRIATLERLGIERDTPMRVLINLNSKPPRCASHGPLLPISAIKP